MKAMLACEDGTVFEGLSIGAPGEKVGELVLNTDVVGYQEIMTDPTNAGKILVLTYPLIGNYGTAKKFYESEKCWVAAAVIKEKSRMYSNWQAEDSFDNFLRRERCLAIADVDTRTLAVLIRDKGEMLAIVSTGETRRADLLKRLRERKKGLKADFIKDISVKKITALKENPHGPKVAILDLGVLNSFVAQLKSLGCNLTVVPYATDAEEILGLNLDGLVVSNGPEEDEALPGAVETVRRLLGKIPLLGISTGHEIICRALGGKLKKMKLGHHGVNYPVRSPDSHKGEITVQNHSFIANESSIKRRKDIRITMRNVNDNSIEEMESGPLRFISAQYYPTSPGFGEVNAAFKRFVQMIRSEKGARGRGRSSTVRETGKDKERNSRCQSAKI